MVGLSRLRFAAGVCVLAAGLLMGGAGGAVAVADPGSHGSAAHGEDGNKASGQQSSTGPKKPKKPKKEPGAGTDTNQHPSTGGKSPKKGGTHSKDETNDSVAAVSNPVAAVTSVGAPVASLPAAPVMNVVAPVPNLVAPVPNLVAPIGAVSVQDLLTSVGGAVVALTQLPSDLSSFLLGIAGVQPVLGGIDEPVVGGNGGGGLSAAPGASIASRLPLLLPFADIPGVPGAGNAAGVSPLGGMAASTFGAPTQVGRASSPPGMAPPAPDAAPTGVQSLFRHVFGDVLLAASTWALITVVLPGVGGLVILIAAGVGVGSGLRASRPSLVPGHWWSSVRGVTRRMSSR
jgi:hypothetical protein